METAMYSMMDVLFRLREGECNDWRAKEQKATHFEYSWFIKGTMKERISPFFPLISSFVWPLVSFFFSAFKDMLLTALTQKQTFECSSYEGFGSLLSLHATRCWWPTPAEVAEDGGDLCMAQGVEVPRGHDLTCFLFCSYALMPAECRLTNPLHTGCLDSTLSHSAVHLML